MHCIAMDVTKHLQRSIQCWMVSQASVDGTVIRRLKKKKHWLEGEGGNIEQLWLIGTCLWSKDEAGCCSGATFLPLLLACEQGFAQL